MDHPHITIHLPSHRRKSLKTEAPSADAEAAYDGNIGAYVRFLHEEAQRNGIELSTDARELDEVYSIEADSRDRKKIAHDWLHTQPDVWNWMPSYPPPAR